MSLRSRARSMAKTSAMTMLPGLRRLVAERDRAVLGEKSLRDSYGAASFRDDLKYVFIVSYGRSGSTLLQGILGSIPGYDIRGENRNAMYTLFFYHRRLERERIKYSRDGKRKKARDATHPFYGIDRYPTQEALRLIRALALGTVLRPSAGTRVTGYKEIRWRHPRNLRWADQPDYLEYIQFLCDVFPDAKFVINSRNHADVARSEWWARRDNSMEVLAETESEFDAIADFLGERAFRVKFDDYIADRDTLHGLFDWLGEEFDRDVLDRVLATKHSVGPTPAHLVKDDHGPE